MSIKVDDIQTWPGDVIDALTVPSITRHFMKAEWVDDVYDMPEVQAIASTLVGHCYRSGLVGYHCTKEKYPGYFKKYGLALTDPQKKVDSFLDEFGGRLSDSKLREVRVCYHEWLSNKKQMKARAGKVWFCLAKNLVVESGTERFFKYYGGEIIYRPFFERDNQMEAFLEGIGLPVVVEVKLDPSTLEFFGDLNLSKAVLSYYGLAVNPSFKSYDIEGYSKVPLSPELIIEVYSKPEFFKSNGL